MHRLTVSRFQNFYRIQAGKFIEWKLPNLQRAISKPPYSFHSGRHSLVKFFWRILYNAEQHSFPRNRECRLLRVISGHNFCWHAWRQFPRGVLSSRQRSTQHETFLLLSFLKGANLNLHSVALLGNDRRTGEISWKPPEKLSHEKTRL